MSTFRISGHVKTLKTNVLGTKKLKNDTMTVLKLNQYTRIKL